MNIHWIYNTSSIDWNELSTLYRIAPLGHKKADELETVFNNSMFSCFLYDNRTLIAAGRALADGRDCSYLCDIAVHPDYQNKGIGKQIVSKLASLSRHHSKIILYTCPGKEDFYKKIGFRKMTAAMAIFSDQAQAVSLGLVD